jgi:hypothetical protein
MPQNDKLELLYNDVKKDYEVGTLDEFKTYLSDDKKRTAFFNEVVQPNYDVKNISDFESLYDLKKKEESKPTVEDFNKKYGTSYTPQEFGAKVNSPSESTSASTSGTSDVKTVDEFNAKYQTNYTDLATGKKKVGSAEKSMLVPFTPIKVKQQSTLEDYIAPTTTLPDLNKAPMKRYENAYKSINSRIDTEGKKFETITLEIEKQAPQVEKGVQQFENELKQASGIIQKELSAKFQPMVDSKKMTVEQANAQFKTEYDKGYNIAQAEITKKYGPTLNSYNKLIEDRKTIGNGIKTDVERAKLLANSVNIIDRNQKAQALAQEDNMDNAIQSGLHALGSILAGTLPYSARILDNNLKEYALKNDMPELVKIAYAKQDEFSKSELYKAMEDQAKESAKKSQYYSQKIEEKEGTVLDNFEAGNYSQAAKVAGIRFAESIPVMAAAIGMTALTRGNIIASIPIGGFAFGSQNYYGEYADRIDMSESDKLGASYIKGSLEMATEVSILPILSPLKNLLKTAGKEAAKEAVKKTLFGTIKAGYEKFLPAFGWVQEGGSEYVNELAATITDKLYDPKFQDKDWNTVIKEGHRRGLEAFGPGAFGGAAFTVPTLINNGLNKYKSKLEARGYEKELSQIDMDIANPTLPVEAKNILIDRKKELHEKLNKAFDEDKQDTAGATTEQLSILDDINDRRDVIENALLDETLTPESKKAFEEDAKKLELEEKDVLNQIKANEVAEEKGKVEEIVNEKESEEQIKARKERISEIQGMLASDNLSMQEKGVGKLIPEARQELLAELEKLTKETKITNQNDKENITGVQSNLGEGQEPIKTKPNETTGGEKVETSGNVQTPKEEITNENENKNKQSTNEANGEVVLEGVRETGNEDEGRKSSEQLQKEIDDLRKEEQAELDAKIPNAEKYRVNGRVDDKLLTNPEDIAAYEETYEKYNKPISDLIAKQDAEKGKETPKAKTTKLKSAQEFNKGDIIVDERGVRFEVVGPDGKTHIKLKNLSDTAMPGRIDSFANVYKGFVLEGETGNEQMEAGKEQLESIKEGKITTTSPVRLFKGLEGKKTATGEPLNAHPDAEGVFSSVDEKEAERYKGEAGVAMFDIPAGTTVEVVKLNNPKVSFKEARRLETEAINSSDAQIVKLITNDAKGTEEQYIIKDKALIAKMQKPAPVEKVKATESEAVKAGVLPRIKNAFLKIGTEIFDNAKALMAKAKELAGEGAKIDFSMTQAINQAKDVKLEYNASREHLAPNGELSNLTEEQAKIVRTPAFKEWAGKNWENVLKDENGEPKVFYHGTTNDFNVFDSTVKGNKEGQLGQMNYFTSSRLDAERNYLSGGPDLTSRIEGLAESIEYDAENLTDKELSEKYDVNKKEFKDIEDLREKAKKIAKLKLKGNQEKILPVFIKSKNPITLGKKSTWINTIEISDKDIADATQEVADDYGVTEEEAKDEYYYEIRERAIQNSGAENVVVEALEKALRANGYDSSKASEILGDNFYEEEIDLNEIEKSLRKAGLYDNNMGEMASSQVISDMFKNLSYDSIILDNVSDRFLNMGLSKEDSHVHVFDENNNNIKLADGTNTTFDSNTSDIRYSITMPDGTQKTVKSLNADVVNGFYSPLEAIINGVKQDKMPAKQWAEKFAKGEEAKWTGLTDWLLKEPNINFAIEGKFENGKWQGRTVSKADIQQYLKDNRIEIVEVVTESQEKPFNVENKTDEELYERYKLLSRTGRWVLGEWDLKGIKKYRDLFLNDFENNYTNENEFNETKFSQYQLEGEKENYKEVLVTMPVKYTQLEYGTMPNGWEVYTAGTTPKDPAYHNKWQVNDKINKKSISDTRVFDTEKEATDFAIAEAKRRGYYDKVIKNKSENFKSSHFEEPNILVHLRMNTRTDAQGNKVLFLEEVQSDWGQEGKRKGFKGEELDSANFTFKITPDGIYNLYQLYNKSGNLVFEIPSNKSRGNNVFTKESLRQEFEASQVMAKKTPSAPFVTDTNAWTKLGLKVSLKEAVKQGATKIAWTTGEQQNNRYDLSKQVDEIKYLKSDNGNYIVQIFKGGERLETQTNVDEKDLERYFGKDVAKRIINNEGNDTKVGGISGDIPAKSLSGVQLSVGGTGMKGFYGSPSEGTLGIVGNVAKSLTKQEPGTVEIDIKNGVGEDYYVAKSGNSYLVKSLDKTISTFNNREDAEIFIKINKAPKKTSTQYSIDITPELAATVEQGQPLFHYGLKGEILGFTHNGKIYLNGEKITAKTTMEEAGHVWVNWAKENRVDLYKAGLGKIAGSQYLADVMADKNYQAEALKVGKKGSKAYNLYMAEEALAKAIADEGAKFVTESKKADFRQWIAEIWKAVAKEFGIRDLSPKQVSKLTLEQFAKKVAADVFNEEPAAAKPVKKKGNVSPILQRQINKVDLGRMSPTERVVLDLIGNLKKENYLEHGKDYSRKTGVELEKNGKKNNDAYKIDNTNVKLNFIRKDAKSSIDQTVMGMMSELGVEDYDIQQIINDAIEIIESTPVNEFLKKFIPGENGLTPEEQEQIDYINENARLLREQELEEIAAYEQEVQNYYESMSVEELQAIENDYNVLQELLKVEEYGKQEANVSEQINSQDNESQSRADSEKEKAGFQEKVKVATNAYNAALQKVSKAKEALLKAGQEQQINLMGVAPVDKVLFGTDIANLTEKVKKLQDLADLAKENLDKAKTALDNFVPYNQETLRFELNEGFASAAAKLTTEQEAEIADLKEQLKNTKLPSQKAKIMAKIAAIKGEQIKSAASKASQANKNSAVPQPTVPLTKKETKAMLFNFNLRIKEILNSIGVPVAEGRLSKKYLGMFFFRNKSIRVQSLFGVATACHEAAHYISDKFGIGKAIMNPSTIKKDNPNAEINKNIRKALTDIYVEYYPGAKETHSLRLRMEEGIAVLLERYLVDPSGISQKYGLLVDNFINPTGLYYNEMFTDLLGKLNEVFSDYASLTPLEKIGTKLARGKEVLKQDTGFTFAQKNVFNWVYNGEPLRRADRTAGVQYKNESSEVAHIRWSRRAGLITPWVTGDVDSYLLTNKGWVKSGLSVKQYLTLIKGQEAEFSSYLVARRNVEDVNYQTELQNDLIELLEGINDEELSEEEIDALSKEAEELQAKLDYITNVINNNAFDIEVARQAVEQNEARFKEAASIFDKINEAMTEFAHTTGILSAEKLAEYKNVKGYASNKRLTYDDIENTVQSGGSNSQNRISAFKPREGSSKSIIDPVYSQIQFITETMSKGLQNTVWQNLAKLGSNNVELARRFELQTTAPLFDSQTGKISYPQMKDKSLITVWNNGKPSFYLAGAEYLAFAETMTSKEFEAFASILKEAATVFSRFTTTANPLFPLVNIPIDTVSAWMNTKTGFVPILSQLSTLKDMASYGVDYMARLVRLEKWYNSIKNKKIAYLPVDDKKMFEKYLSLGGSLNNLSAYYDMTPEEMIKAISTENVLKKGYKNVKNATLGLLELPGNMSENITRFAEYKRAKEKGYSDDVAMYMAAHVSTPFIQQGNMGGRVGQAVEKSIPYFHSALQVLGKYGQQVKEDPIRVATITAGMITIAMASVLATLAYSDDEDKKVLAEQTTDQFSKNIYFPKGVFGGKGFVKIRIPETIGMFTGAMTMAALQQKEIVKKYTPKDWLTATIVAIPTQFNVTKPLEAIWSWQPQLLKPSVEVISNTKAYPELAPIVNEGLARKLAKYEYNQYTSLYARELGAMTNMSPILIEHFVKAQFGKVPDMLLDMGTEVVTGQAAPKKSMINIESKDFILRGRAFNEFYANSKAWNEKRSSIKDIKAEDGNIEGLKMNAKTFEKTKDLISLLQDKIKKGKVIPTDMKNDLYELLENLNNSENPREFNGLRSALYIKALEL